MLVRSIAAKVLGNNLDHALYYACAELSWGKNEGSARLWPVVSHEHNNSGLLAGEWESVVCLWISWCTVPARFMGEHRPGRYFLPMHFCGG